MSAHRALPLPRPAQAGAPYARVLVATDLRGPCEDLVAAARRLAPGARMEVLHVLDTADEVVLRELDASAVALQIYRQQRAQPVRLALDRLLDAAGGDRGACAAHVEFGSAREAVPRRARAFGADLVVLRARRSGALARLFRRGVAQEVLARVRCDLLLLPAPA